MKQPKLKGVFNISSEGALLSFDKPLPLPVGKGRVTDIWVSWDKLGKLVVADREVRQAAINRLAKGR